MGRPIMERMMHNQARRIPMAQKLDLSRGDYPGNGNTRKVKYGAKS